MASYLAIDLLIRTADGASIAAIIVRPKAAKTSMPMLLGFTIYPTTTGP